MPFLKELTATNRGLVFEIGDVDEEKAVKFLMDNDTPQNMARAVYNCIGSCLVYLNSFLLVKNKNW